LLIREGFVCSCFIIYEFDNNYIFSLKNFSFLEIQPQPLPDWDRQALRRVIAYLMAGILISYGFNPNPLRRGYNRTIYTKIPDINVYS